MVNMSDCWLAVCGCDSFVFVFFYCGPQGCKHSLHSNQSSQCKFNLKRRRNKSENVVVTVETYFWDEELSWQHDPSAQLGKNS